MKDREYLSSIIKRDTGYLDKIISRILDIWKNYSRETFTGYLAKYEI
jgi:hypothetical protein